jgi:hypothetical protein
MSSSPTMMSAKTPLIPKGAVVSDGNCPMQHQSKEEHHNVTTVSNNNNSNDGHAELQFYDPASILNISKEIAFGYLILLTGGAFVYEAPSTTSVPPADLGADRNDDETMNVSAPATPTNAPATTATTTVTPTPALLNEETTSLAYAALTDGNVLHACFGLKATANGRSSIPTIGGKHNTNTSSSSSLSYVFCCFSTKTTTAISSSSNTSSGALQLLLPHLTRNKMKMQTLVELLREVRELHNDEEVYTTTTNYTSSSVGMGRNESSVAESYASVGNTTTATPTPTTTTVIKVPLYLRVIYAYIHCFTCIVKYHDAQELLHTSNTETNKQQQQKQPTTTYSNKWWWCFTKPILDPKLELLRSTTLVEIAACFTGLKEDIWEEIEMMANKSAISTMGMSSVEGSAVGSTLSSSGGGGRGGGGRGKGSRV